MALEGVLANIPGLAGYLGVQQYDQQRALGNLQGVMQLAQAADAMKQRQMQQEQLRLNTEKLAGDLAFQRSIRGLIDIPQGGQEPQAAPSGATAAPSAPASQPAGPRMIMGVPAPALGIGLSGLPGGASVGSWINDAAKKGDVEYVDDGSQLIPRYKKTGEVVDGLKPIPKQLSPADQQRIARENAEFALRQREFYDRTGQTPPPMTRPDAVPPSGTIQPVPPDVQAQRDQFRVRLLSDELERAKRENRPGDVAALESAIADTQRRIGQQPTPAAQPTGAEMPAGGQAQPATMPSTPGLSPEQERKVRADLTIKGWGEVYDSTKKRYESLQDAPVQVEMIRRAQELIPQAGPFTGSFAESKERLVNFLNNNLGTTLKAEELANAGALRTALFSQIMDNLKKMDAQPSQMQQQIMMQSLGNLNNDPNALQKMLGVMEDVIRGKVDLHNRAVGRIPSEAMRTYEISLPAKNAPSRASATATAAGNFPKPGKAAIDRLKANPAEKAQYEAVFGPGSAAQVLGQ